MKQQPDCKELSVCRGTQPLSSLNECQAIRAYQSRLQKGYELTAGCFINSAVRKTAAGIYKEICEFCKSQGHNTSNLG